LKFRNRQLIQSGGVSASGDKSTSAANPDFSNAEEREMRTRLENVLDVLDPAIIIFNRAGVIVHRNLAGERFKNARHGDAVVSDLIGRMATAGLSGDPGMEELELLGPPVQVWLIASKILGPSADPEGIVVAVHDITALRRVEKIRGDFVANVTHELKTPIGALAILAETIATSDKDSDVQELAESLVKESTRLGRMVDDLLDLSTIEMQSTHNRSEVALVDLIEEAMERVSALARQRAVALNCASYADQDIYLFCDRAQIVNALTNLLENAVKYSDSKQVVTITAALEDSHQIVNIEIIDEGIGIPTADLERIFERFYRVDKARSRSTGGTGLGLSIVRHVAEAHGGTVRVESQEGEGSRFTLSIPSLLISTQKTIS